MQEECKRKDMASSHKNTDVFEGPSTTTADLSQFKSAELEDSIELLLYTSLTSSMDYSVTDPNS